MNKEQDSFASDTPPVPEPTSGEVRIRYILAIAFPALYFSLLALLHVYWLTFNHPDLKDICIAGDGIFAAATNLIVGHYVGSQNTISAVNTGVKLEPMARSSK